MLRKVRKFVSEMIPVLLGVLLALLVNNWNEQRKDKAFVNKAFDAIKKEITENREELDKILPGHYAFIDSLAQYTKDENMSLEAILINTNGLQMPTIKSTAWKFYLGSNIELIDYQRVSILSGMDETIKFLEIKMEQLMEFATQNTPKTDSQTKKMFTILLLNVTDSEEQLKEAYEAYLDQFH